ncbi:hypothetical protein E4T47_06118 [Aureobasidium subglaciale]|nr:hypothetical protein E4T47_06118 [Aureobasidium subglaciale]
MPDLCQRIPFFSNRPQRYGMLFCSIVLLPNCCRCCMSLSKAIGSCFVTMRHAAVLVCLGIIVVGLQHHVPECLSILSCSLLVPVVNHRGKRWQPNMPLPPQLCRGVSCISSLCSAAPVVAGLITLTVTAMPSLRCTVCATLLNLSWFIQSTSPNLVILSPGLRPAVAAGDDATTLLTLAKGASSATREARTVSADWTDVEVDAVGAGAGDGAAAAFSQCSCMAFSMRAIKSL